MATATIALPESLVPIRENARKALGELRPAGPPSSDNESHGLMMSSRTDGGRDLPPYYLVYFLLVDLLEFKNLGQWEKVAWIVPVRYHDRLYSIEHRKMGLGIFAPTLVANARMSQKPSAEAEADAREISKLIKKSVQLATPYFEWRAEQEASGSKLNVINNSVWLFDRYLFFSKRYRSLMDEVSEKEEKSRRSSRSINDIHEKLERAAFIEEEMRPYYLRKEADWNAQAAIDAFFSWTEHVFIHLAILQGKLTSGDEVASIAEADWKTKFRAAFNLTDEETKSHYDSLLDLRAQIRNFMAHGAFGKRGEAFQFHSGAGAVPVLLTRHRQHRFALTGSAPFNEHRALEEIESFIAYLWSGVRAPARDHIMSGLVSILTYAVDGTYASAMSSAEEMKEFVDHMERLVSRSADMDW